MSCCRGHSAALTDGVQGQEGAAARWAREYGPVWCFWMGAWPVVMTDDPELARCVWGAVRGVCTRGCHRAREQRILMVFGFQRPGLENKGRCAWHASVVADVSARCTVQPDRCRAGHLPQPWAPPPPCPCRKVLAKPARHKIWCLHRGKEKDYEDHTLFFAK